MECREAQIADLQYLILNHTEQAVHLSIQYNDQNEQTTEKNRQSNDHLSQSMLLTPLASGIT